MDGRGEEGHIIGIHARKITVMGTAVNAVCKAFHGCKIKIHINLKAPRHRPGGKYSNFHNHRQNHGIALGGFKQIAAQIVLNGGLDGRPIPYTLALAAVDCLQSDLP